MRARTSALAARLHGTATVLALREQPAVAGCSMAFSEYVSTAAAATATAFSRSVDQGASRNRDTAPYVRLLYEVATTIAQNLLSEAKKET